LQDSPLLGSLTLGSRLSICGSRQHIQFRPNDNNRELHTKIPDGFKETTPLRGITTEKSFWLNNGFEEGVPTRYSQEKNLSRIIIPKRQRIFPVGRGIFLLI
jgi:hypothetical protein